jgi:hypothetical protein
MSDGGRQLDDGSHASDYGIMHGVVGVHGYIFVCWCLTGGLPLHVTAFDSLAAILRANADLRTVPVE